MDKSTIVNPFNGLGLEDSGIGMESRSSSSERLYSSPPEVDRLTTCVISNSGIETRHLKFDLSRDADGEGRRDEDTKYALNGFGYGCSSEAVSVTSFIKDDGPKPIEVFVKTLRGNTITCKLNTLSRLKDLQKQICEKTRVPESQYYLVGGVGLTLNDANKLLSEYGVLNHTTVYMTGRLRGGKQAIDVFVKTLRGETITCKLDTLSRVEDLQEKVSDQTEVPISQFRLQSEGKNLNDPNKLLSEYGVLNHTTLHMTGRLRGGIRSSSVIAIGVYSFFK